MILDCFDDVYLANDFFRGNVIIFLFSYQVYIHTFRSNKISEISEDDE